VSIGLGHYLTVSGLVFSIGLYCLITRRNAVALLMGVELILNAAILNLVAFSRFGAGRVDGQVFALFGIVLADG
jgi:NADH-quinone oxidoreductase subunit K